MKYFILVLALLAIPVFTVHAATPQETLNQYVSELRNNPNDTTLREKIIRHVQTMKIPPAIQEEAKRYMARGKAAFKAAKEEKDFNEAAEEFKKALLAAPWLAEGYYNLGIVQDKAGQYAAAMDSLKLYIIAAPNAPDEEKVKELIYEIEYRKEKAAKESSPDGIAAKKQNEFENLLKKIDGRRYTYAVPSTQIATTMEVRGKVIVFGIIQDGIYTEYTENLSPHVVIQGRKTTVSMLQFRKSFMTVWAVEATYIISEDGDRITQRIRSSNGAVVENIHLWQR